MSDSMRVAAVIVTFNRKELLKQNIQALLRQVKKPDGIVIVDNHSSDGTQVEIMATFSAQMDRIDYNYLPFNTGGAGGFEYGTRRAYDLGFELVWLMDDDGLPMDDKTLQALMDTIEKRSLSGKPFLLNAFVLSDSNHLCFSLLSTRDRYQIEKLAEDGLLVSKQFPLVQPFNGTLVSRALIDQIGFPNGQFIIYGDETEYVWRALESGAFVATVISALYYHPSPSSGVCFCGKTFLIIKKDKWKYYYHCRNAIYRLKAKKRYWACVKRVLNISTGILYADDQKWTSLQYTWRGFADGMRGRLGAVVGPPAQALKE